MSSEKEEEKKSGGALPPWMGGSARVGMARGGGALVRGGTAAGRLGGLRGVGLYARAIITSKLGAAAIVGLLLAVSSYGLADMHKRGGFGIEAPAKSSGFRSSYNPDGGGGLSSRSAAPSSLDFASQANKGLFGDGAQGGEAAPSADAPKDEAAAGEETPQAPAVDAAAMAQAAEASAGAGAKGLPNAGYGKFSSGMGGLAGGGGMAGGVGQSFQSPKLGNTKLAQAQAFSRPTTGKVVRGMTPANARGSRNLKGATARRLDGMNKAMAGTRKGNAEAGSAVQTQQWSNANPTGSGIQGGGVSDAGAGGFSGEEGVGAGNPVDSPGVTPTTDPPPVDGGKNVTPYQSQVDMAVIFLTLSAILMIVAYLLSETQFGKGYAALVAKAAAVCAGIAALMGLMIMASGQMGQGLIFTACGAIAAYLAWTSVAENGEALIGKTVIYATAVSAGGAIAGSLMTDKTSSEG